MAVFKKLEVFNPPNGELVTIMQNVDCVTGSVAINDEFHDLLISVNGKLIGPLGAGRYTLDPRNSPYFNKLRNYATGGKAPINVTLFYVSKQNFVQQWGTGEIVCSENILKIPLPIRIALGGNMVFKVTNSKLFLKNLVGLQAFDIDDLAASTRALIIPKIRDAAASRMREENFVWAQNNVSFISNTVKPVLTRDLSVFGIHLTDFSVACFNINKEDLDKIQKIHEKRVEKFAEVEAMSNEINSIYKGNVYDKAKVEALINFSKNQGNAGEISQWGMLPMLMNIGRMMSDEMNGIVNHPRPTVSRCEHCNAEILTTHNYCPNCGNVINI